MKLLNNMRKMTTTILSVKHLDDSFQEKKIFEPTKSKRPGFPTHPRKDKSPGRFLARAKRK